MVTLTGSHFQKEASDSVLTSVDVPDVKSIFFHPIKPSSNHRAAENQHPLFPLDKIPFKFQLDDIHSNFVQVRSHFRFYLRNVRKKIFRIFPVFRILRLIFYGNTELPVGRS